MKIWSSHLLDNLSNCLMNLKNSGHSTGFEPMTSATPVQCSNQLSYEVTQLRAGQFVGLMFSRERNVVWKMKVWKSRSTNWPALNCGNFYFTRRDSSYTVSAIKKVDHSNFIRFNNMPFSLSYFRVSSSLPLCEGSNWASKIDRASLH